MTTYHLNESDVALIQNALVCYADQLIEDERDSRIAADNTRDPVTHDALMRLAEAHAHAQRRVRALLEIV